MRTAEAAFLDGKVWDHPWAAAATAQAWDALVWMADQHDDRLHGKPPPFLRSFLVSPCSKAPTSVLSHLQPIVRWHSDHHTQFGELAAQAQPARSDAFGWAWKRTSDRGRMVIAAMEQGQHHLLTPEILDAPAILSILPRLALKAVELGHGGVFRAVFGAWIRDGRTWPQLAQLAETTWGTPLLHHGLSVIFLSKLGGKAVWLDSLLEAGAHLQLQVIDHNGNTALHALLAPIASDLNDLRTSRYLTQRLIARCVPLGVINHAGKDVLDLLPACFSDLSSIILARRMDTQMHRPEAVQARIRL